MDLGLDGLGVLVTGGGGFLGSAVCRAFAEEGARVAVHHRGDADREAALEVAAACGGVVLRADLASEAQADAVVPAAVEALGRLDVCVANAGRFPVDASGVREMSVERWSSTLADNLTSVFLTARGFLRHVAGTGSGSLVLMSSAAGVFGDRDRADYAATKAAIVGGLLPSLKNEMVELAPEGRVNAVVPAWTTDPTRLASVPPEVVARTLATQARPRLGLPTEVAAAVVWLASPVASHVTGHAVQVTGGMEGRLLRSADPAPAPAGG
jgi:3-oxoacyl-[acyl-carrier protein] reductase